MRENDGRRLDHKTLEEIRMRVVKQVEAGESPEKIISALGFAKSTVYNWIAKYREGGMGALEAKPLYGRPTKLTGAQIRWVYKTIVTKSPLNLRFEFALWTREMVRDMIEDKFGAFLSVTSVGRMLKKLGLTAQKPLRRAYQQDKSRVERWLKKEYPEIKALAKKEGADLYFGDEASVRSDHHSGTTWGVRGQTPVAEATGARFGLNLISAVSPRGAIKFMVIDGRLNAGKFREFLGRLMHGARRPVFLIVDGHSVHRSDAILRFVASTNGRLRLFHLPPYSPALNPGELVWNNLKNRVGRKLAGSREELEATVLSFFKSLQESPRKVRDLFREKHVRYVTM